MSVPDDKEMAVTCGVIVLVVVVVGVFIGIDARNTRLAQEAAQREADEKQSARDRETQDRNAKAFATWRATWHYDGDGLESAAVPGGRIYLTKSGAVFVPTPDIAPERS